jgi:hypothetical protein
MTSEQMLHVPNLLLSNTTRSRSVGLYIQQIKLAARAGLALETSLPLSR